MRSILGGCARHLHFADKDVIWRNFTKTNFDTSAYDLVFPIHYAETETKRGAGSKADPGSAHPVRAFLFKFLHGLFLNAYIVHIYFHCSQHDVYSICFILYLTSKTYYLRVTAAVA